MKELKDKASKSQKNAEKASVTLKVKGKAAFWDGQKIFNTPSFSKLNKKVSDQ
jgi:hypothetical protein